MSVGGVKSKRRRRTDCAVCRQYVYLLVRRLSAGVDLHHQPVQIKVHLLRFLPIGGPRDDNQTNNSSDNKTGAKLLQEHMTLFHSIIIVVVITILREIDPFMRTMCHPHSQFCFCGCNNTTNQSVSQQRVIILYFNATSMWVV